MSTTSAREHARQIRECYFRNSPNPQLAFSRIFEDRNITKQYVSDGPSEKLSKKDGKWVIPLPVDASQVRENFTIAHELGHIFLNHALDANNEIRRSGERNSTEAEANAFAAELLMPENLFRDKAKFFDNDERRLAAFFGVSPAAVMVRLSALHLA